VLLGSSPRLPIGETMFEEEEYDEIEFEEALRKIMDKLQESFSILEDHGLVRTIWDEDGNDSLEPTEKMLKLERQGKLRSYVKNIFQEDE